MGISTEAVENHGLRNQIHQLIHMFQDVTSNFCQYSKALENPGYQGSTSWLLAWDLSQLLGHPSGTQERTRLDRTDLNQGAEREQICPKNSSHLCKWHGSQRGRRGFMEKDLMYTCSLGSLLSLHWKLGSKVIGTSAPIQAQWLQILVGPKEKGWLFFLHFRSLTKPMQNDGWKITFFLGRPIFRGYVKLAGSNS